jgi:hypothetical protein
MNLRQIGNTVQNYHDIRHAARSNQRRGTRRS